MEKTVLWSKDAQDDLIEIVYYIKEKSGSKIAKTIYNRIIDKINNSISFPESHRVVPELSEIGVRDIKEIIDPPWRIFYRISDSEIKILSIIDGRRNIEDILYRKMIDGKLK